MVSEGTAVRIAGLTARPDLNNLEAVVLGWHAPSGRWAIRCGSESIRIREANVAPLGCLDNLPAECFDLVLENLRCLRSTLALACVAQQPRDLVTAWVDQQKELTLVVDMSPALAAIAETVTCLLNLEKLHLHGSSGDSLVEIKWLRSTLNSADFKVDLSSLFRSFLRADASLRRFAVCAIAAAHVLDAKHIELYCIERGQPYHRIPSSGGMGGSRGANKRFTGRVVAEAEIGMMMDVAFELAYLCRSDNHCSDCEVYTAPSQGVGNDAAFAVAHAMRYMAHLRKLELNHNMIGDDGACLLAANLGHVPSLQQLGLSSNPITDRGVAAIADAIATHQVFRLKHVLSAHMHERIMANLAHPWNPASLEYEPPTAEWSSHSLELRGCHHNDIGLAAMARAIQSGGCCGLKSLALGGPKVTDAGIAALSEGLRCSAGELGALTNLDLSCPSLPLASMAAPVGVDGCVALAKALSTAGALPWLEELRLDGRLGLGAEGFTAIKDARPKDGVSATPNGPFGRPSTVLSTFLTICWPRHA